MLKRPQNEVFLLTFEGNIAKKSLNFKFFKINNNS